MEKNKALEKLFAQLNRRVLPPELKRQFYPFGRDAFEFLEVQIDLPDTTHLQVVNSLIVMGSLRHTVDQSKFFMRLLRMSKDLRKDVRSQAIGMAVNWTRFSEERAPGWQIPEAQRDLVMPWAKDALALGLDGNSTHLVKAFIACEI